MKLRSMILMSTALVVVVAVWTVRAEDKVEREPLPAPKLLKKVEPKTALTTPRNPLPDSNVASNTQYRVDLKFYQGDPLGSRKAGTLKSLAEPTLQMLAGYTASFLSGGSQKLPSGDYANVGFTFYIQATPEPGDEGNIRLKIVVDHTEVVDRTDDGSQFRIEQFHFSKLVEPKETIKLRLCKPSEEKQTWVEVKVQPIP